MDAMRHHLRFRGLSKRHLSHMFSVAAALPRRQARLLAVVTLVLSAAALKAPAQHNGPEPPPGINSGLNNDHDRNGPTISPQMQEQQAERRNSDRQRQLIADTEKLFQLAGQLRDEVSKSNKDQLSIPVIKKSEEIEKLAKSVKERMRGF